MVKDEKCTSAVISGLYFGYLKACSQLLFLAYFESPLSHIPYATGYTPEDLKKSIYVILENKGKGVLT